MHLDKIMGKTLLDLYQMKWGQGCTRPEMCMVDVYGWCDEYDIVDAPLVT